MFRKKDADAELTAGEEGAFRRSVGEGARTTQAELPHRKVDLPGAPGGSAPGVPPSASRLESTGPSSSVPPAAEQQGGKRLIVGQGIRLSGEISSCDRLVVEGEVEVTLNDTLALEIASSGRFTGGCEVEEAEISGVYEGDLTVRRRLLVRGTGKLTGTVRYGELELERGGQIAGNISVLSGDAAASPAGTERKAGSPSIGEPAAAGVGSAKT